MPEIRGSRTSAGRLHTILTRFSKIATQRQPASVKNVWLETLGLNPAEVEDLPLMFTQIAALQELALSVLRRIDSDPDANRALLEHFANIQACLWHVQMDIPATAILGYLEPLTLRDLMYIADWLSRQGEEQEITPDEIAELASQLDELAEQIRTTEIESDVQRVLLDLVETMRHGLRMYKIWGAEAFREAVSRAAGTMTINADTLRRHAEDTPVRDWGAIFGKALIYGTRAKLGYDLLKAAADVVAIIHGHPPLPQLPSAL